MLICFIVAPAVGLKVSPSSTQATITQSFSVSSSSSASSINVSMHSQSLVLPTPTSLPHHGPHTCKSGPDFVESSNKLAVTDHVYLDISEPVNCTGMITRWHYCHIVIGFRSTPAGLWLCVYRRSNDSDGYESVGCNKFTIIPGNGDDFRCRYYVPPNPLDVLRVEEGDYIGFFIPDSGLFLALSPPECDAGNCQLAKNNRTGFSSFISDSELINASSIPGRALLSAEIGTLALSTVFCGNEMSIA